MNDKTNDIYAVIQRMFGVIAGRECLCTQSPEFAEFVRNEEATLADIKDPAERMLKLIFSPMFSELHPDKEEYTSTCLRCELLDFLDNTIGDELMSEIRKSWRHARKTEEVK
jgi:hypothetical protein